MDIENIYAKANHATLGEYLHWDQHAMEDIVIKDIHYVSPLWLQLIFVVQKVNLLQNFIEFSAAEPKTFSDCTECFKGI